MQTITKILKPLASLRLTVALLAMAMVIVFAGTLAQRSAGIETVKHQYFHTVVTWVELQNLLPFVAKSVPGSFPMPGGWTIIALMLVNLLAAHSLRFKPKVKDVLLLPPLAGALALLWAYQSSVHSMALLSGAIATSLVFLVGLTILHRKRAGIIVLHMGLIFLLLGELVTSVFQVESQMTIAEGSSANYASDIRETELAITDTSSAREDQVSVIAERALRKAGTAVRDAKLPFDVEVHAWFANSKLIVKDEKNGTPTGIPEPTAGVGLRAAALEERRLAGVSSEAQKVDMPAAYMTFRRGGQVVGTYLLSLGLGAQELSADGKTYAVELRFRRDYKPFSIYLKDFSFKRYVGTEMAKDYASVVQLRDPANGVDREVRIWMNHPLRYNGETYYQSSFTPDEKATVLQVVRNPAWLMPYFSCAIVGLGLAMHFPLILAKFLGISIVIKNHRVAVSVKGPTTAIRPGRLPPPPPPGKRRPDANVYTLAPDPFWTCGRLILPALATLVTAGVVLFAVQPPKYVEDNAGRSDRFDFAAFARLPINHEGRPMPMEALARDLLKVVSERESFYTYDVPWPEDDAARAAMGKRVTIARPQVEFLLNFLTSKPGREDLEIFRIKNQELLGFLQLDEKQKRYSLAQILAHGQELQSQIMQAGKKRADKKDLSIYEENLLELAQHVGNVRAMEFWQGLILIPPPTGEPWDGEGWRSLQQAATEAKDAPSPDRDEFGRGFFRIISAYAQNDPAAFNSEVAAYERLLDQRWPAAQKKLDLEVRLRWADPFFLCCALYATIFLVASFSWLGFGVPLRRAAMGMLLVTFVVHTGAMLARLAITGRPPVTTLYTSAIFIGWGAILVAIFVEFVTRKGLATAAASVIGFLTLLIAYFLYQSEGDTMKQLQAVLDTNLWLWVHVQTVTFGYAATFLAWLLGVVYIVGGLSSTSFDADARRAVSRATYGVVCFAMFLSFVGTTTGGIWADQSWGRFWGWDPKENGAILIVLWNALILHARWAGLVRERGIALMAVVGGVVTSWSWFGTNMLGVGLHSYGFMEKAVLGLVAYALFNLLVFSAGSMPQRLWRSYAAK